MKKILLIDDSNWWLKRIKIMLEGFNYEVDTVSSVNEGISKAKEKRFDCIVTDLLLPDGNGFDVLKELKDSEIPIIVLTADFQQETIDKCKNLGAFDVIQKELVKKYLVNSVKDAVKEV